MRLLLMVCLCSTAILATAAEDEIDQVVAERDAVVAVAESTQAAALAKAQAEFDAAADRADAKAVVALERIAKRAARSGDMTTGARAWKAVLRYDREHAEASGFFQAVGQLDSVLAELGQDAQAADLIGGPQAPQTTDAPQTTGIPLRLAMLGTIGDPQIRPLSEGTDAIGGLATPITAVPAELSGASFIQPPLIATAAIQVRSFRQGSVAVVAGPGYAGMQQITAAGFTPASFVLGVANSDQIVYLKSMVPGEELQLPAGPLMLIAGTIRSLPSLPNREAGRRR